MPGDFEPQKFQDQYENAVKELLKKKQQGVKREPAKVVNLMEALRKSIEVEGGSKGKPPARSVQHRTGGKKKAARSSVRQRKAG